jgi:nitroreductase
MEINMTPYEQRQRNKKQPTNIVTNEFIEGILGRKTIRRFDANRKITDEQLEYLVAAAQCSPTSSAGQSWSVISLVTDKEKRDFMRVAGQALDGTDPINALAYNECAVFLIWIADNYKIASGIDMVARRQAPPESEALFAPLIGKEEFFGSTTKTAYAEKNNYLFGPNRHIEWLDQSYYCIRAVMDATIAAQTFSLCAESIGIGTMYMGSIPHCDITSFKSVLKLPDRTFPIFGMCVGYEHPDGTCFNGMIHGKPYMEWYKREAKHTLKPRQPQELVLHRGSYNSSIVREWLKKYNDLMIGYYKTMYRKSDYLVKKCVERIKKSSDQLATMRLLGNRWR